MSSSERNWSRPWRFDDPGTWPAVLLTTGALALAGVRFVIDDRHLVCGRGQFAARPRSRRRPDRPPPGAPGEVTVTVTEADGCVATPDTVPAGQVTFVITNVDALGVTEVELVSDQRIVGERENLAPGFDSTFSARLDGGTYEVFCPGASDRAQAVHRHRRGRGAVRRSDRAARPGDRRLRHLRRRPDHLPAGPGAGAGRPRSRPATWPPPRPPTSRPGPSTSASSRLPSRSPTSTRPSTCGSATSRRAPPGPGSTPSSRHCSRSRPPRA